MEMLHKKRDTRRARVLCMYRAQIFVLNIVQQVVILKNNGNNDVWGLKNIKELPRG
jgi:hypothetical protein